MQLNSLDNVKWLTTNANDLFLLNVMKLCTKVKFEGQGFSSVANRLPGKREVRGSIPGTKKEKKSNVNIFKKDEK